ncbi:MAG TPA: LytTR family DNA-binding domain-containing protein [Opitutaceae bacterium]|nr:LytTR family DNA-binding domain-containing protein [Opitutaceae bacterium]
MPPEISPARPLRVLIVDDEPVARRRLRRFLQNADGIALAGECGDGAAAVAAIRRLAPDIVFLDVQMPGMNGFEVLRALGPAAMPVVIFVTAFDQFALQAFEAQAVDYLLKPFGEERVSQALARARLFLDGGAANKNKAHGEQIAGLLRATAAPLPASALLVKRDDRVLVLQPGEIDWLEADGDYVRLHVGGESHLTRATLTDMERRLRPAGFVRIHRSRLVNLSRVKELRPLSRGESVVLLKNGVRLEASYAFMKLVQDQLGGAPA